jgi:sugar phosphate isomerase/epimerase
MLIGAQLFTLRDFCKTTQDLDETLKKVADMGMTTVQLSGVCGYEAEWMDERLKAYGLTADITHFAYDRIVKQPQETADFHNRMGCKYIGIGGMPQQYMLPYSPEKLDGFIAEIRPSVETFAANGNKFMYHNHNREFAMIEGKTVLEHLCDAFTPEQIGITADVYWMQYAGENPVKWLYKLAGRTDCVHFKDMFNDGNEKRMSWVGGGNMMNFEQIAAAFIDAGAKYAYVEQDDCYGEDPFECLKKSYAYLRSIGLE